MKLFVFSVILLILPMDSLARNITHEDIRDAMISLVHMFRASEDKLDRHESREKALGDQLKKGLAGLDKRHKSLDPLKGAVSRLDERLSNVETIIIQKEEREKAQSKKNDEIMVKLLLTLETWGTNVTNTIKSEINTIKKIQKNNTSEDSKLAAFEDNITKKIDTVMLSVESIKKLVTEIKDVQKQDNACKKSFVDTSFSKQVADTEKLLTKYDLKLNEYNVNMSKFQPDIVQLSEISQADDAWHSKMSSALEKQQKNLMDIQKSLQNTEEALKGLSSKDDVQKLQNQTIDDLNKMCYNVISTSEKDSTKLLSQLTEINEKIIESQDEIIKNITGANEITQDLFSNMKESYELLGNEMKSLSKMDRVMIQTADNVLETKRRIEYGIHQIVMDLGDIVNKQGKDLNTTIHTRFNDLEISIIDSQTGALTNLSSKLEHEISQVWRQIGIMYQQVTASKTALDRLQAQTESYVNGTVTTIDGMEGKVGMITSRISEVGENLNYFLGKLNVVTQEFNQIRVGLGNVLDNIQSTFLSLQEKMKALPDVGPGPHRIVEKRQSD